MNKPLKKLIFFYVFIAILLISVDISFGITASMERDNWVVEGKSFLKKNGVKEPKNFRDIKSNDKRAMLCLLSRNSCIKKCIEAYKKTKKESEEVKIQGYNPHSFLKRKCILTCNWNHDICTDNY